MAYQPALNSSCHGKQSPKVPVIEGWELNEPHHVRGGSGANADSPPYYRIFAKHAESKTTTTITGGTRNECVANIQGQIKKVEAEHGLHLKLPPGWSIDFVESANSRMICMQASNGEMMVVSAFGVSMLDARVRLLEQILTRNFLCTRISNVEDILKRFDVI